MKGDEEYDQVQRQAILHMKNSQWFMPVLLHDEWDIIWCKLHEIQLFKSHISWNLIDSIVHTQGWTIGME